MTLVSWLAFLLAAGIGAPARYLLDGWVHGRTTGAFPWGTFTVNASGCLALGVVAGLTRHHGLGSTTAMVVGTGALGAYTTFSTFTYECVRLAEEGALDEALGNAALSFVVGLAAASAGLALTTL